jgi:putative DNA primase/helicase
MIDATPEAQAAFELANRSARSDLKTQAEAQILPGTYDDAINRLASLPRHEYDRVRVDEAKALNVRTSTLDDAVKVLALRNKESYADSLPFSEVEPYPDPINPGELLDDVAVVIKQFIILDTEQAHAVALWISATWFVDVIYCAPICLINAPEKACGKSQLLTLLGKLVPKPAQASGISPSVLFRMIEAYGPTLLVDEVETVLTKENEELRGLINAGHTRDSAYVWRSVSKGDDFEPRRFSVWGMKAIAGINADRLAETVTSRSVVINLRKKLPHEKVDRLRNAPPGLFDTLKAKLARFATDYSEQVKNARPSLPDALGDRAQDNWEPLLSIAGCAGPVWVDRATKAALKLCGAGEKTVSTANELLADIQHAFATKRTDKISTTSLITALCEDDEGAWATYNRGKPITPRQVARLLAGYEIASKTIRIGYETAKGFESSQFADVFERYLLHPRETGGFAVTTSQPNNDGALSVTDSENVTVTHPQKVTLKPASTLDCYRVTDKKPVSEEDAATVIRRPLNKKVEVTV